MPLPATRNSTTDVGSTEDKRPSIEACPDAQIGSLLRSSKCEDWQVSSFYMRQVQCRNIQDFPKKIVAMPHTRQSHSDSFGQCPIPPCSIACTISDKISSRSQIGIFAAIQSTVSSNRASMEACPAACYAQPVFCIIKCACRGCRFML
jgi:hypothetical protein